MKKKTINLPKLPHHRIATTPQAFDSQTVRLEARELVIPLMREFGGFDGIQFSDFQAMMEPYSQGDYDSIKLQVHSNGGDCFVGCAIYNHLIGLNTPKTAVIGGIAASAATLPVMAADTVYIGSSARMMIHRSWSLAMGNAEEMRETADLLEGIDNDIAGIYADRTGISKARVLALMTEEHWMSGEAAIEQGFADALMPKAKDKKPQAKFKDREMHGIAADVEKWLQDKKRQ